MNDIVKYKIVNKSYTGIQIDSYIIENNEGKHRSISVDDTIKLARANRLSNAKAILNYHTGEYILSIDGGLHSIPDKDRSNGLCLSIIARIMDSENNCVGYKVTDGLGKYYKFTPEKVWELAEQGAIPGLEVEMSGRYKILRSSDTVRLIEIPKIDK